MLHTFSYFLLFYSITSAKLELSALSNPQNRIQVSENLYLKNEKEAEGVEGGEEEEEEEEDEQLTDHRSKSMYEFLFKRMNQDVVPKKKKLAADVYRIPGPQEPLPGRSHQGDYWPVFPFQNQYSAGLDLDPSISRHIGGDLNIAVPSWGVLDIYGRFFNRIHDTTTKIGYINQPVNMLDLDKNDFIELMSDPGLAHNRRAHPTLPIAKFGKTYVPMSCKPPMCNPYTMNFGLGIEHDFGGNDGIEGDIDVPLPISKGIAYRFPFSGKIYYDRDNVTVTYGQNLGPIEPFSSLFDYQKHRDPQLAIPRRRVSRSISDLDFFPNQLSIPTLFGTLPSIRSPRRRVSRSISDLDFFPNQLSIPTLFGTLPSIQSSRRRISRSISDLDFFPNQLSIPTLFGTLPSIQSPRRRVSRSISDLNFVTADQFMRADSFGTLPIIQNFRQRPAPYRFNKFYF